jgi:hypothetical protein
LATLDAADIVAVLVAMEGWARDAFDGEGLAGALAVDGAEVGRFHCARAFSIGSRPQVGQRTLLASPGLSSVSTVSKAILSTWVKFAGSVSLKSSSAAWRKASSGVAVDFREELTRDFH